MIEFAFEPRQFERKWLETNLHSFAEEGLIEAILYPVKGGKEASVYCCQAGPGVAMELLAAKVYRPRRERAMRNQAAYQLGRDFLGMKEESRRQSTLRRAVKKRKRFGRQVEDVSWIAHEFESMSVLRNAGGSVPMPVERSQSVLLMEYIGDENEAAPALNEVTLSMTAAHRVFDRIVRNIELLLSHDRIHGDLSPYNVLYWEGKEVLIDLPQVVDASRHPEAFDLLARDVHNICKHFRRYIPDIDPTAILSRLVSEYHQAR